MSTVRTTDQTRHLKSHVNKFDSTPSKDSEEGGSNRNWRNPGGPGRRIAAAVAYGLIGAMAASVVGAVTGHFFTALIVGSLIGAWAGAQLERQ